MMDEYFAVPISPTNKRARARWTRCLSARASSVTAIYLFRRHYDDDGR